MKMIIYEIEQKVNFIKSTQEEVKKTQVLGYLIAK